MDGTAIIEEQAKGDQATFVGECDTEAISVNPNTRNVAVVDGLNVAYSRNDHHARLEDIIRTEKLLSQRFDKVETFIDASGLHKIDNRKALDDLVTKGKIVLCPARIRADDLIWLRSVSLANRNFTVWIVTNDMFPMYRHYDKGRRIRNLTATIMRSGDVYLLEREIKYLDAKPTMEVGTEAVEVEEQSEG